MVAFSFCRMPPPFFFFKQEMHVQAFRQEIHKICHRFFSDSANNNNSNSNKCYKHVLKLQQNVNLLTLRRVGECSSCFNILHTWKLWLHGSNLDVHWQEWIKKLWYINTMECYLAIKNYTSESVIMRQMNLKPIIQSEVSQKEKNKYHILTYIDGT